METRTRGLAALRMVAYLASAINVLLALNFFPVVPLLGWLNYGRANWATAWMPDGLLLGVLPAAYYVYWHFWFVIAVPAFGASLWLCRQSGHRAAKILAIVNAATVGMFWAVRIVLWVQGIHPDIV